MVLTPDNAIYSGLFGDEQVAAHLSAEAEIASMVIVERALARAQGSVGAIPQDAAQIIDQGLAQVAPSVDGIAAGTAGSGIPVPALVAALRAALPPDAAHWVHWGATTQDIMDTGLVLRLREIFPILDTRLLGLITTLADMAEAGAQTPMAGRTRTQIATPITFGLRVAQWMHPLLDLADRRASLQSALTKVQFGGASGANSAIAPHGQAVMQALATELDLQQSPPWHTNRVAIADLVNWCAALTNALARLASDVVLMLRREIAELRLQGGGGSSTMPNKANPVQAEVILALARHMAGLAGTAALVVQHPEERDGPAWMQEWLVLPQTLIATGAALRHASDLIANISSDPQRMAANLDLDGGAVHAEAASFALARHMPRADAQALVKQAAAQSRTDGTTLTQALKSLLPDGIDLDQATHHATPPGTETIDALVARARHLPKF